MIELKIKDFIKYKSIKKSHSDYSFGGWYMIKDIENGMCYIGKSIEYKLRLRQHISIKNPKTLIDKAIKEKGIDNFKYYLLYNYVDHDINFFNRKLEIKIENKLIGLFKTKHPNGYNIKYYE